MLIQMLHLQPAVEEWLNTSDNPKLRLLRISEVEVKHMKYIVTLLYPFYCYTKALSTTSGPTIHMVWRVYNKLFQHLENQLKEADLEPV